MVRNIQHNIFNDNELTNLDGISVNRNLNSNIEVENKNFVDDSIGEGTKVRFSQTLDNYLKFNVGNDTHNQLNMIKNK